LPLKEVSGYFPLWMVRWLFSFGGRAMKEGTKATIE